MKKFNKLKIAIYISTIIFLIPTISFWLLYLIPGGKIIGPMYPIIFLLMFFSFIIFLSKIFFICYLTITSILFLTSFGIFIYQKRQKVFSNLIFYLFLLLSFSFVYLFGFKLRYHPSLKPKSSVNFQVVDSPSGYNSMYRTILVSTESSDNKFEILGWLDNDTLIYKKWSKNEGNGDDEIRQYNFVDKKSSIFDKPITNLNNIRCSYEECISNFIDQKVDNYSPDKAWISPNGKRFAFLASYLYGPQDIMIFEK